MESLLFGTPETPLSISPAATNAIPNTLLTLLLQYIAQVRYNPIVRDSFADEYDYVIVGSGASGSVLANRLSELPFVSVLVLEAGGEAPPLSEVPSYGRFVVGTEADWNYTTVPQENCAFGLLEQRVNINSGRVLGGTTILGNLGHARGNKQDFENWVQLGATGWGYDDLLPFFKQLEDNRNIGELDDGFHGIGGPLTVSIPDYEGEIRQPIFDALDDLDYRGHDYNGRRQTGITKYQANIRDGRRCSASKAYLVDASLRENLDILTGAHATQVLFDKNDAVGVQFRYNGELRTVKARKEVILSAGAIRTPHLLMLSGIGPCSHLQEFNINCIKDLPVGRNLQDHFGSSILYTVDNKIDLHHNKDVAENFIREYVEKSTGPLASVRQIALAGFMDGVDTSSTTPDLPRQGVILKEFQVNEMKSKLLPEVYSGILKSYEGQPLLSCKTYGLHPESRGQIRLNSSDPFDYPLIDPKYYSDPRDILDVLAGLKICLKIGLHEKLKVVLAERIKVHYPRCQEHIDDEDELLKCEAYTNVQTMRHFVGTARMGGLDDENAVVDTNLKVKGVNKLRVVDESVFPLITSGSSHVPELAIAEKIADSMKQELLKVKESSNTGFRSGFKLDLINVF